jgi:hypothetical protein
VNTQKSGWLHKKVGKNKSESVLVMCVRVWVHDSYKTEDKEGKGRRRVFCFWFVFLIFFGWLSREVCFRVVGSAGRSPSSSHGVRLESCFFKLLILGQIIRRGGGKSRATNMSLVDYASDDDAGDSEPQPMVASPSHR